MGRKVKPHPKPHPPADPVSREVREAIRQLACGNAGEEHRLRRAAQNYSLLREELALLGACLLLRPHALQPADRRSLAALLWHEPLQERELPLTLAGLLDVPEPETFCTSELGEEILAIFEEAGRFDTSDLATLSLTYRRYLSLRAVCFDG